jgi:hypothetical protein
VLDQLAFFSDPTMEIPSAALWSVGPGLGEKPWDRSGRWSSMIQKLSGARLDLDELGMPIVNLQLWKIFVDFFTIEKHFHELRKFNLQLC